MSTWIACSYRVESNRDLRVEWRGDDRWAVWNGASCFNRLGEWEYEPFPSSRDDEFIQRCRYSLDEAMAVAEDYLAERKLASNERPEGTSNSSEPKAKP